MARVACTPNPCVIATIQIDPFVYGGRLLFHRVLPVFSDQIVLCSKPCFYVTLNGTRAAMPGTEVSILLRRRSVYYKRRMLSNIRLTVLAVKIPTRYRDIILTNALTF